MLGGQGNKFGVIIGAFLVAYIPARFAEIAEYKYLIFGVVLILLMLFRPQGLLPARHRLMGAGPDIPPVTDPVITGHTEPDSDVEGRTAHVVPGSSPLHRYEDDGRGPSGLREGNGLRGVRERVDAAGGSLRVRDAAPGTRLEVTL